MLKIKAANYPAEAAQQALNELVDADGICNDFLEIFQIIINNHWEVAKQIISKVDNKDGHYDIAWRYFVTGLIHKNEDLENVWQFVCNIKDAFERNASIRQVLGVAFEKNLPFFNSIASVIKEGKSSKFIKDADSMDDALFEIAKLEATKDIKLAKETIQKIKDQKVQHQGFLEILKIVSAQSKNGASIGEAISSLCPASIPKIDILKSVAEANPFLVDNLLETTRQNERDEYLSKIVKIVAQKDGLKARDFALAVSNLNYKKNL